MKDFNINLIGSVLAVVPISGGKDSQLCMKLAVERFGADKVIGLFCDTGWEHPLTYQHVKRIEELYEAPIYRISRGTVEDQVIKNKRFPANLIRFCTNELKISASRDVYKALAEKLGGFEVWYGMRSGESVGRKMRYAFKTDEETYQPHDVISNYPKYLGKQGVRFKLPILNLSTEQVLIALDGNENPLYKKGFDRVGCFPCLASSPKHHQNAFEFDQFGAQQKIRVMRLEDAINKRHDPARTAQLCMFCEI